MYLFLSSFIPEYYMYSYTYIRILMACQQKLPLCLDAHMYSGRRNEGEKSVTLFMFG